MENAADGRRRIDQANRRDQPAFKITPIEFTPGKTGEFTFVCGMNMLCGKLIVEPNGA